MVGTNHLLLGSGEHTGSTADNVSQSQTVEKRKYIPLFRVLFINLRLTVITNFSKSRNNKQLLIFGFIIFLKSQQQSWLNFLKTQTSSFEWILLTLAGSLCYQSSFLSTNYARLNLLHFIHQHYVQIHLFLLNIHTYLSLRVKGNFFIHILYMSLWESVLSCHMVLGIEFRSSFISQ